MTAALQARALRLVLAAALLAAWQGALVHPLEHVGEHGELVPLTRLAAAGEGCDGHDHGDSGPNALCDVIAAVAAVVDGYIPLVLPVAGSPIAPVSIAAAAPRGSDPPAYRSQAPPQVS